LLDKSDADLFCPAVDRIWSRVIPATLFVHNATGYCNFFEEELSKGELGETIKK
jgi:hypothetical protein